MDERLIELAALINLVYSPLVDTKEFPENVDVALVEGAVSNEDDLEKIQKIRERTRILVSLGDCAVTANVPSMRNRVPSRSGRASCLHRKRTTQSTSAPGDDTTTAAEIAPGPRVRNGGCLRAGLPTVGRHHLFCSYRASGRTNARPDRQDPIRSLTDMPKEILINPVTRIEGHSKITIRLDDKGEVADAQFHVTQFRGFEKFCEGRPFTEMPSLTARTCGICPVSHLMASAKACDALLAVEIPPTAAKLRRLMNLAQLVQSHALSFFHLSSPDLLFGMDSNPDTRNIFGVVERHPFSGERRYCPPQVRSGNHCDVGRKAHPSSLGRSGRR